MVFDPEQSTQTHLKWYEPWSEQYFPTSCLSIFQHLSFSCSNLLYPSSWFSSSWPNSFIYYWSLQTRLNHQVSHREKDASNYSSRSFKGLYPYLESLLLEFSCSYCCCWSGFPHSLHSYFYPCLNFSILELGDSLVSCKCSDLLLLFILMEKPWLYCFYRICVINLDSLLIFPAFLW